MKDVEIVIFNDKSWVRFTEYRKLDEELKQEKQSLAKRIYELQSDLSREKSKNEKLKAQIEKMKIKKVAVTVNTMTSLSVGKEMKLIISSAKIIANGS